MSFDETARSLRQAFDDSFRHAPAELLETEDFLAIGVAGEPYAIRLAEVAGLYADRKIVPFPSRSATTLGIVGLRGTLVPVHDLAALLGHSREPSTRWLLLLRGVELVGMAFSRFDAHLRVPHDHFSRPEERRHVRGAVRTNGGFLPIIDGVSLLASTAGFTKER